MTAKHFAFLVLITFVWALSLVAVSIGVQEMPPLLFTGLRFLLLAVILAPFLRWHRGQMGKIAIVAMGAGALQFGLFFTGIYVADDLSSVAIATQLGVPFTTLLSMVLLGETVGWRRWLGMALSFVGVMAISFDPRVFAYIDGMAFGVAAALVGAVSIIVMRQLETVGVFALQAWIALLSWPLLLPASLVIEGDALALMAEASWRTWAAIAFTALVSNLVAHAGLFYLIQRYEVSRISPLTLMTPVFTVILGVTVLGDVLTGRMVLGGVITLIGVLIISVRRPETVLAVEERSAP
ncbi:MAG: DMT family transporter [Alphaproteobacteria bacterium]